MLRLCIYGTSRADFSQQKKLRMESEIEIGIKMEMSLFQNTCYRIMSYHVSRYHEHKLQCITNRMMCNIHNLWQHKIKTLSTDSNIHLQNTSIFLGPIYANLF